MGEFIKTFAFDRNSLKEDSLSSAIAVEQSLRLSSVQEQSSLSKAQSNVITALRRYTGVVDAAGNVSSVGTAFLRLYDKNKEDAWSWLITRALWLYVVPNGTAAHINGKARELNTSFAFFKVMISLLTHLSSLSGDRRFLYYDELLSLLDDDENWKLSADQMYSKVLLKRDSDGFSPPTRILLGDLEVEYGIGRDNFNTILNKAFRQTGLFEYMPVARGGSGIGGIALAADIDPILQRRIRFIMDSQLNYSGNSVSDWAEFLINPPDELPEEVTFAPKTSELVTIPDEGLEELIQESSRSFDAAGLVISPSMVRRFVASLLTKRFVILTGLSGSGKTKLAQAFASWLSGKLKEVNDPFYVGAEIPADTISYFVEESGPVGLVFRNKEDTDGSTFVGLPRSLIKEWSAVIKTQGFSRSTRAREIRAAVSETSSFSPQLNSFETHLKAAAFASMGDDSSSERLEDSMVIVPIGSDWDNNENLLGYPDSLRQAEKVYWKPPNGALDLMLRASRPENVNRPFFLILDEMNLSHVERYFADFLSSMESGEPLFLHSTSGALGEHGEVPNSLKFPDNLFIIGTVNIDETTYLFSPKVLDRANTIEFQVSRSDMADYLKDMRDLDLTSIAGRGIQFGKAFVEASRLSNVGVEKLSISGEDKSMHLLPEGASLETGSDSPAGLLSSDLLSAFDSLSEVGAEFGYRTTAEIRRFFYFYTLLGPGDAKYTDALDAQVMQKLLPKLHGSVRKLDPVLDALVKTCERLGLKHSVEKLERMRRNLQNNGFTSFAEA